ncbi:MAG TPA: DoxX family protein [Geobacteraceae bacterium]|nr:DoxX family protein [Geobacteraceae bacterium]
MKYTALLGRILYAAIFLMSGPGHFTQKSIGYAAAQGVPLAFLAVPISGILAIAGGLSILLGYKAKYGACLLVIFLVPVTLFMHRFWGVPDTMVMMQKVNFMKNMSMIGAALLIANLGSGPLSLDERLN